MSTKKTPYRKEALGRGLHALLDEMPLVKAQRATNSIQKVSLAQISFNPFQPRKYFSQTALQELSDSIKLHGIIQPITIRKLDATKYQLVAGERRLRAAKLAGLTHIPAYIRTTDDQQMLEIALVENLQREDLNPIEIALSYQQLLTECNIKQETLGIRVGKNRATVNNYLRLLKLPPAIQLALRDKKISMGHARALINVQVIHTQLELLKKIIEEGLSVREVEARVSALVQDNPLKKTTSQPSDPTFAHTIKALGVKLSKQLGTNVKVQANTQHKGEVKIPFNSPEDLHRILDLLAL